MITLWGKGPALYLAVRVIALCLVGFIDHHTLHLQGWTSISGQVIDHHLRSQEEDAL